MLISLAEKLSFISILIRIPFAIFYAAIFSRLLTRWKNKKLNRVVAEATLRFLTYHASFRQIQWFLGQTIDTYKVWAKSKDVTPNIEEAAEGKAKLVWLTERRTDRVLLYLHGGGYICPATDTMYNFVHRIGTELQKRTGYEESKFGIVVLAYSLMPNKYPTQLTQCTLAVSHLLSLGIKPENLVIISDSAGSNMFLQLLTHTLHPYPSVPISPLASTKDSEPVRLGGVCLMSPWISLDTATPSHIKNAPRDLFVHSAFVKWGKDYVEGVPESQLPWIKPIYSAPDEHWLEGFDKYAKRVLITAGGAECLLNDSLGLYEALKRVSPTRYDLILDVEEDGIHEDPIYDVQSPQRPGGGLSDASMRLIGWIGQSFGI